MGFYGKVPVYGMLLIVWKDTKDTRDENKNNTNKYLFQTIDPTQRISTGCLPIKITESNERRKALGSVNNSSIFLITSKWNTTSNFVTSTSENVNEQ
ncbi:MAG: hypothetical protein ACK46O_12175 [Flavobacteriia bacterium]|jgi:hypothetical protein